MIYIYSQEASTRFVYIVDHIFNNMLGIEYKIIGEKDFFRNSELPLINYSREKQDRGVHIYPEGLLEEKGIRIINPAISEWEGYPAFFHTNRGDIPFDIFSAAFYLLTSYEEYYPSEPDEHGRFRFENSLLYRNNLLEIPIIDRWAHLLKKVLLTNYPDLKFSSRNYRFISTFDIDLPYLYRKKGILRSAGGIVRDLAKLRIKDIGKRISVNLLMKSDPYMKAIRWIDTFHQKAGKEYFLFVLLSSKGKYGNATVFPLRDYHNYLRQLESVTVGLHPSYDTYKNLELLIAEKKQLESILDRRVTASRQHFLRISIPETFQELKIAGLAEDFSLAFAKASGFRSGTAIPYFFYDLEKEQAGNLLIRPTVVMDSTLITHWGMTPEDALAKIKKLADECKKSEGDYLSIWHNSNLAGNRKNNPWIDVFIESFKYASALEKNT